MSSHDLFSGTSTRTCDLVASRQIALLYLEISCSIFVYLCAVYFFKAKSRSKPNLSSPIRLDTALKCL